MASGDWSGGATLTPVDIVVTLNKAGTVVSATFDYTVIQGGVTFPRQFNLNAAAVQAGVTNFVNHILAAEGGLTLTP